MSFITQDTDMEYQNGNQYVKLIMDKPYLTINEPTKLKIKLENIDVEKITVTACGISSLGYLQTDTQLLFKVLVDENSIYDGKYEINIIENDSGKLNWKHTFKIPVKIKH